MKILVTGGTGKVGSAVLKQLQARGADLRALVRKKNNSMRGMEGVEIVEVDLIDPVSVEKALDGVDKLYLLNAVVPDELTQGLIAFGLAQRKGLKHVVYHSVFKADQFKDVPHFASKLAIENAMHESRVPYTIIRPNYFHQNDEMLKDALTKYGVYPMPLGDEGVSSVDVRDIAEATAIALTTEGHEGRTYNLIGPDALSGPKAAQIWSEVLGKDVHYTGHDMNAFEGEMRKNMPSWSAYDLRTMFQGYLEKGFVAEPDDLQTLTKLLGHPPLAYSEFARETAESWKRDS